MVSTYDDSSPGSRSVEVHSEEVHPEVVQSDDVRSDEPRYDKIRYDDDKVREIARRLHVTDRTVLAYLRCHAPLAVGQASVSEGGSRTAAGRRRGTPTASAKADHDSP